LSNQLGHQLVGQLEMDDGVDLRAITALHVHFSEVTEQPLRLYWTILSKRFLGSMSELFGFQWKEETVLELWFKDHMRQDCWRS